jgi:ribosome modulation factor
MTDAYQIGYRARVQGQPSSSNPFVGADTRRDWWAGWDAANKDLRKDGDT